MSGPRTHGRQTRRRRRWAAALRSRIASLTVLALAGTTLGAVVPTAAQAAAPSAAATLYAWGDDSGGAVGVGNGGSVPSPVPVTLAPGVAPVSVSAGDNSGLAIGTDGLLYGWGANDFGQLGDGTRTRQPVPVPVHPPAGETPVQVDTGDASSILLTASGKVYTWGADNAGQLGVYPPASSLAPVQVTLPGNDPARWVTAHGDSGAAIGTDGQVFVWGSNNDGVLGDGTAFSRDTPEPLTLPGGARITSLATDGALNSFAIDQNGLLYGWGDDSQGQLGDAVSSDPRLTPAQIPMPGGVTVQQVAVNFFSVLALATDGTLYSWGANQYGQLGDGSTARRTAPEPIALPGGARAVKLAKNFNSTYVVDQNGHLWAWGENDQGQLGDGTTTDHLTPEQIPLPGAATAVSIAAGAAVYAVTPGTSSAPQYTADTPPTVSYAGGQYQYRFAAGGSPLPTFALAPGAPPWLAVDPLSGEVSGTVPAGTTGFDYSVTATNPSGSVTAGPFTVRVGTPVPVTGTVTDPAGAPATGALVQLCGQIGCSQTTAGSDGSFHLTAVTGDSEGLSAYPPAGSTTMRWPVYAGPYPVTAAGLSGLQLAFTGVSALPSGTAVPGSSRLYQGIAGVVWANSYPVTATGCANGIGTVTIAGADGTTDAPLIQVVPLTETPAGSGNYTGTIPPLVPMHGPADLQTTVTCLPVGDLAPRTGPAAGGTAVVLSGSGFTGATGVSFGTVPATAFTVVDDHTIQATAPAGSGTVQVAVSTPTGTAVPVDTYTYQQVATVTPNGGPVGGGTKVTITGSGLDHATQVFFGTVPARFTQDSDTQLTAVSPPGSGDQDITVSTLYGTTTAQPGDLFHYGAAPTAAPARTAAAPAVPRPAAAPALAVTPTGVVGMMTSIVNHLASIGSAGSDASQLITAINQELASVSCDHDMAYLKAQLNIVASVLLQRFVSTLISQVLVAAIVEAPGLPVLAVLMPLAIIALTIYFNALTSTAVDAGVDAWLGKCGNQNKGGPGGPQPGNGQPRKTDLLIDPSGTVLDTNGNPVAGATVTILRADTADGPFSPVDTGAPGIVPAVNPETTAADGVFHWDVRAGSYEVRASAPGCGDPVTIGPYPVPPPQTGLTVTLACANPAPAPQPVVSGLDTAAAPAGTTVRISGSGFAPGAKVSFGGTPAASVAFLSPQTLTAGVPAGAGSRDITVSTAGGSSATSAADRFFTGAEPGVTALSANRGPTIGGSTITVTGSGFTGATAVLFGTVPASSVTVDSDTSLRATVPAGAAGTADVTVVTPVGPSAATAADRYTYGTQAPAFSTAAPPLTATAGTPYTAAFTASGDPAPTYALAAGAPSWLAIDPHTGTVTGTPPAGGTGFAYAVTAANIAGTATAGPFQVSIRSAAAGPVLDSQAGTAGDGPLTVPVAAHGDGDLLVAFVAADGPSDGTQQATVSGGGLSWELLGRTTSQHGTSEVWTARTPKRGTVPVTSTLARAPQHQQLTVLAFTPDASTGKLLHDAGRTGAPTGGLTTTLPDAQVFAVGNDWGHAVPRVPAPGQALLAQSTAAPGDTFWVQTTAAPAPAPGTRVTITDLAPSTDPWNLTLIEIVGNHHRH
ncbi:IPT/TIG domain-containing protein [Kitasatospora sp. NPDC006697]|uniref:RCC1 domain-containing protein n=1 Tax=Kitasatospora sp. NPDC006697 TaxID=3364020 RepID=UPI003690E5DB